MKLFFLLCVFASMSTFFLFSIDDHFHSTDNLNESDELVFLQEHHGIDEGSRDGISIFNLLHASGMRGWAVFAALMSCYNYYPRSTVAVATAISIIILIKKVKIKQVFQDAKKELGKLFEIRNKDQIMCREWYERKK